MMGQNVPFAPLHQVQQIAAKPFKGIPQLHNSFDTKEIDERHLLSQNQMYFGANLYPHASNLVEMSYHENDSV